MKVVDVFTKANLEECLDTMVYYHRRYYNQPGYILNKKIIREKYSKIFNNIVTHKPISQNTTGNLTISKNYKHNIYDIMYNGNIFRDIDITIEALSGARINSPKDITYEQIVVEILFDYSYHKL